LIKKILISLLAVLVLLVSAGIFITVKYKKAIINYFITEANNQLNTPVNVGKIDISLLEHFPDISILLNHISIHSGLDDHRDTLAYADQIQLAFNLWALLKGRYELHHITVEDGVVTPEINEQGMPNYSIFKKSRKGNDRPVHLKSILLKNVKVVYHNREKDHRVHVLAHDNRGKFSIENGLQKIQLDGKLTINTIDVGEESYFKSKEITSDFNLIYNPEKKFLSIQQGHFTIEQGAFEVNGNIALHATTRFDLTFQGINTDCQTILSVLPEKYVEPVKLYRSRGEVYFDGKLTGDLDDDHNPHVEINFGATDASFYHPDYNKRFEKVNFKGAFTNGRQNSTYTSSISLQSVSFLLEGELIKGDLQVNNFKRPYLTCHVDGVLDVNSLFEAIPAAKVRSAFGRMDVDVSFSGRVDKAGLRQQAREFSTKGEVIFDHVSFVLKGERLPFNNLSGSFIFNRDDLAISNFTGQVGSSDFSINGFFKNTAGLLYNKKKVFRVEADLRSEFLDFDELLKSNFAALDTVHNKGENKYRFNISRDLMLDFNCNIKNLKFKRFRGKNIRGNLKVEDQIAVMENVRCTAMGGKFMLSGSVNSRAKGLVEVLSEASLSGIYLDSIFYVFKNFDQTWLRDENLKGRIFADINTYMLFDNYLRFNTQAFRADINASIEQGELLNFEPMQRLSKYVEEESLSHLRFSDLRNNIKIENRTIYLPKMAVASNITNIDISGTHTFDQEIDYHLSVPLSSFLRVGKLKDSEMQPRESGSKLMLKITGTTDDYDIAYDTKAVSNKIRKDIRKEGRELKETFKNKGQEKEDNIILDEEEYFEFDN